jgi:hypothetical protein
MPADHGLRAQPRISSIEKVARRSTLPEGALPRGFSRTQAAAYIGVSPTLFDEMVRDGRMPGPKRINSRTVWDRWALDLAFDALPEDNSRGSDDTWDKVAV